jgi:hypothetical protein
MEGTHERASAFRLGVACSRYRTGSESSQMKYLGLRGGQYDHQCSPVRVWYSASKALPEQPASLSDRPSTRAKNGPCPAAGRFITHLRDRGQHTARLQAS